MIYKLIEINGYTTTDAVAIYFNKKIETHTIFDPADFDHENAELALQECNALIKLKEQAREWVPGSVTAYIAEYEYNDF